MEYSIGANRDQIETMQKALQKGFSLQKALLRANIKYYTYKTWYKNYLLKEYIDNFIENNITHEEWVAMNEDNFINDLNYQPEQKDILKYQADKEFSTYINKTHGIVSEVRRANIILEDYLICKTLTEGNRQWNASAWMLERLFRKKYAVNDEEEDVKVLKPVSVEFIKTDGDEDRVKKMEELVDKEINGESKA